MTRPAPLTVDVTTWLITQLAGLLTARVASRTPADLATQLPFVRVVRAGGPNDGVMLDQPTVVFHCFADSDRAANALAYQVGATVRGLRGVAVDGAVITRLRTLSGPLWADYEDPAVRHTVLTLQPSIKTA